MRAKYHFHQELYERLSTKNRFEKVAKGNSEMAYFILFSMKHIQGFCC